MFPLIIKMRNAFFRKNIFPLTATVIVAVFATVLVVYATTTVGEDISVGDDLTVTGALTADTPTFVIDDTNNLIGLGTTTPWALLTVGSSTPTHITSTTGYRDAFVAGILEVDGVTYLDGAVTAASTFAGTSGTFSTTLGVTGATTLGTLQAGITYTGGSALSTTTPASMTMKASDFTSYSSWEINPTVGAVTMTFPASSTLSALAPNAGDSGRIAILNATSTVAATITLAAGTGETLQTGTSTLIIYAGRNAILNFIRKANTDLMFWLQN